MCSSKVTVLLSNLSLSKPERETAAPVSGPGPSAQGAALLACVSGHGAPAGPEPSSAACRSPPGLQVPGWPCQVAGQPAAWLRSAQVTRPCPAGRQAGGRAGGLRRGRSEGHQDSEPSWTLAGDSAVCRLSESSSETSSWASRTDGETGGCEGSWGQSPHGRGRGPSTQAGQDSECADAGAGGSGMNPSVHRDTDTDACACIRVYTCTHTRGPSTPAPP